MTWHQMTMDRTWGKVSAVLLYSKLSWETLTVLLWLVNQTCPLGFRGQEEKSMEMRLGLCAFVCICVCSCMQACACLLFSLLPQSYNMSEDYPVLSFLIKLSLSFPLSPSVLVFYCINLLKHFKTLLGMIWTNQSVLKYTFDIFILLNLDLFIWVCFYIYPSHTTCI